ncbi:MAG: hypothetical protein JJU45_02450 [Acidimicrobiia bacterium]|nr:hypothetical protein [Acidimicrobiia bacterium]
MASGSSDDWRSPTDDEWDALEELGDEGTWEMAGTEVRLSSLDKELLPAIDERPEVTKGDLVRHVAGFAPQFEHYLADRAVNLLRVPDGLDGDSFWQQAVPQGAPEWVRRWQDPEATGRQAHDRVVVDGTASLVWLAQMAAVELHPWTSSVTSPDVADYALVDIDPGEDTTWEDSLTLARLFRTALAELDLVGCPKVTGKRGLQIWVPAGGDAGFDDTSRFVEQLSRHVGGIVPELVSWRWRTDERQGKARLDYTQNARHKTLVAPWSVRAAPGGPVSVPIGWDELDDEDLRPDRWCVADVAARFESAGDPFAALVGVTQELPDL